MAQTDCPLCGGSGWKTVEHLTEEDSLRAVSREKPTAPPNAARRIRAVPCDCTGKDRVARALARARIPARYEHCDFENFETDNYTGHAHFALEEGIAHDRNLGQAKLIVEAFSREYPMGSSAGLLLMGRCGSGKTHLAVAALRQLVLRGHSGFFCDYGELLRTIQGSYSAETEVTEMVLLTPVLNSEILLLDDLGWIKPSDWVRETVSYILNSRYNAHRTTILTTVFRDDPEPVASSLDARDAVQKNNPPPFRGKVKFASGQEVSPFLQDTLDKRIGERMRSRLFEVCKTIDLSAPDYRRHIRIAGRVRL